jgi:hypothetical protein
MRSAILIPALLLAALHVSGQGTQPGGEYIIQGLYSPTLLDAL